MDGYSGYNQIIGNPKDHEETAFTCTFAYRCMSFELCNASTTFKCCMQEIFSDLIKKCIKVFIKEFFVFGASYDLCVKNSDNILKKCVESNLILN